MSQSSEATAESFETFDSFDGGGDEFETFDTIAPIEEDEIKEPVKKEKVSEDLKVIKDSQADSEGKVIKEDGEEDADEEKEEVKKVQKSKKEESFDDEEEEPKAVEEKAEETEEEDKPKSKLRMKMGDDLYNITSDATFKVKVDGEVLDVPVQELVNNYSGKTAWDKKFTELGKEKKTIEVERNQVVAQKNSLTEHVNKALLPLTKEDGNPLDSLLYLVEMSGQDPYTVYKRSMEANLDELSKLLDMGETERELYFHKKKDELQGKVAKQRNARYQEEQKLNQFTQKVNQLRQAHNVSEEQFVDASDELEELFKAQGLDAEGLTEEQVVDYASLKPHIAKVRELVEPYEDNISESKYGDVVAELSRYLRNGEVDEKTISEILKRNFSVEEDVKELNTKVYQKQKAKVSKKVEVEEDSNGFESFNDWD